MLFLFGGLVLYCKGGVVYRSFVEVALTPVLHLDEKADSFGIFAVDIENGSAVIFGHALMLCIAVTQIHDVCIRDDPVQQSYEQFLVFL